MLNKVREIISSNTNDDILYKKWDTQHRDEYFSKVYWHYHPSTEKYFFEGNPSFLHEYKNLFDCGRFPIITLRDGFVGILEFFLVHPTPPKDFKSMVLINKKFASLIPIKWKEYVLSYVVTAREQKNKDIDQDLLLLYGFGTEDTFWEKSPKELLNEYAEISKGYKETICIFPQRESLLSTSREQTKNYAIELIKETYRNFGFDVKLALDFKAFFSNNEFTNFSFLGLDKSNVFVADSYFEHFLYSSGGQSLNKKQTIGSDFLEYNLSANHKIVIEEVNFDESIFAEFYIQYRILGRTDLSIYQIYQSPEFKKMFLKYFTSNT
jgi:hypothetical protein